MKMPSSIVSSQVDRLLDVVRDYQDKQCQKIRSQAQQEAQHIIRQAYGDASLRLHQYILESRDRMQREIVTAKAKSYTIRRQLQHKADRLYLNQTLDMLEDKLITRWQNKEQRQRWGQKILLVALQVIPSQDWLVEHPDCWSEEERQNLIDQARQKSKITVNFAVSPDIIAGIRIRADGATVDGSLPGLLAHRSRIESEFLAQRQHCSVRSEIIKS
jgi:vacuolar-type H+-ATPase subunit E/Vma4